ncbi:hypothetical protein AND_007197 [Anopheles darlingi]|uniref:Uncharacterized protein n=1 Tax=Anopheles darlingi TaxID=43151 RepID=W5JEA7_ANODA|nr:hypothetical protein AND_007197 [Anopheles darlingi]
MSLLDDRGRSGGLETLQSSYKCYDGIPTPSPIGGAVGRSGSGLSSNERQQQQRGGQLQQQQQQQQQHGHPGGPSNRSPSLDSLVESFDPTGSDLDDDPDDDQEDMERLSDSDSIAEIGRITGQIRVDVHRRSDLEDVKNVQPLDGPVIKAFLEKSHEQCEYTNCGYRKRNDHHHDMHDRTNELDIVSSAAEHGGHGVMDGREDDDGDDDDDEMMMELLPE